MTSRSRVYGGSQAHTATYRSGLEKDNAGLLKRVGQPVIFEQYVIDYIRPESKHKYTPDFLLTNNIIIETKGIFDAADRKKHQLIQKQHPSLDIRFVFSNSRSKLYKGSPTTYAKWCERNGFLYADKLIPKEWISEPVGGRADPFTLLKPKTTGGKL